MDKEKYVQGLLAFYELARVDVLKGAYIQGYLGSASRYDAYAGRDRATVELEARRRSDIHASVKAYVESSVNRGLRLDLAAFIAERFATEPAELREKLLERVGAVVAALNDANHIAYGIRKATFEEYLRLP
jgi:hypothetical protein